MELYHCNYEINILMQVKVPFDANKLYASEILSILLQNAPENRHVVILRNIDIISLSICVSFSVSLSLESLYLFLLQFVK